MKLPVKTRILEWAILEDKEFYPQEVVEILNDEYPGERQTNVKNVENTLEMYTKVGLMDSVSIDMDDKNELKVSYRITQDGKNTIKYIPGHGNKYF